MLSGQNLLEDGQEELLETVSQQSSIFFGFVDEDQGHMPDALVQIDGKSVVHCIGLNKMS